MDLVVDLLKIASVLILPIAVASAADKIEHAIANDEFRQVPVLLILAKLQGFLIGAALLWGNLDASDFHLERLFTPDSPWNLSYAEFLLQRSNPLNYGWAPVLAMLRDPSAYPEALLVGAAILILPAVYAAIAFRLWSLPKAWRAIAACGVMAVACAWLTVYLVALTFWGLYMLNFWALAIIAAYYQYRRYNTWQA